MTENKFQYHLENVFTARRRLRDHIWTTPLLPSETYPELWFKAENLQRTGSFKVRPAFNQLLGLSEEEKSRGVVTSSSGNFGQALAYAARQMGVSAKVVMMRASSPLKVERTREWGAEVVFCDNKFEARAQTVQEILEREGRSLVHPYDHPLAVAGNGTIALEILDQLAAVRNIVVPISGGGLIAGVALAAKLQRPGVRIWGVQPEGSNAAYLSFQQGRRLGIKDPHSIADGLLVAQPGELTFTLMREFLDEVVTVSESCIQAACRYFLSRRRLVVEPSGAVPLAAIIEEKAPQDQTVLVLSGGNVKPELVPELL